MEDPKNFHSTQIEEIYAIHFIYYPVKIMNYGGVSSDKFPPDCMSEAEYDEFIQKSKFGTNLKLNESSIKGSVRSELIRFCFKLSPPENEPPQGNYSLIDVTFPKNYPQKSPYIVIKMTMSMSTEDKKRLTSKLMKILKNLSGNVSIFEVSLAVNDIMNESMSNDREGLTEGTTDREESEDYRDYMPKGIKETSDQNESNEEEELLTQEEENTLTQEEEEITKEDNYKHTELSVPSFPIWSVQSLVQSPVWYENFKSVDDKGKTIEDVKLNKNVIKSQIPKFKITNQTMVNELTPQSSFALKEKDDNIKSPLSLELYFTNESVKNLNEIKNSLNDYQNETYDRYERDYVENEHIYKTTSMSMSSVKHVLDQNLYYIKILNLPTLCPYINLSNVDGRQILHNLRIKRKLIVDEITSKVSQLSKLEHNSICRYYQSWLEKKLNNQEAEMIIKKCEEILDSRTFVSLYKQGTKEEKMILLFKYASEVGKNFLHELVTERKLFIQLQNFNSNTLRNHIENEELYRDEKLIWNFIRHLLDVLAYLHQNNVYHQSLSLDNIYVHTDMYGKGLKVSEFGITHLLRKILTCENECNRKNCECQQYRKILRKQVYKSHPSSYGITSPLQSIQVVPTTESNAIKGYKIEKIPIKEYAKEMTNGMEYLASISTLKSIESQELEEYNIEETFDPVAAEQEDMFALGIIIFKMWHPPLDEKGYMELLSKIVNTQKFPDYFINATPPIIITTLTRLLSREKRPTAIELLRETLVPPVMDIYMYKQYLRKLENPMSEESLDALKFLLYRDWKSDISKYKHNQNLEILTHKSYVTDSLERFMRNRGVIVSPPLPLQIKTMENNDKLLGMDGTNTVFSVGGSIRDSLLRSFELYSGDDSGIGVKQFSLGEVYDEEKSVSGAVFSITIKIESDENVTKSVGKKGLDYTNLDDNCTMMVSTQVDLIIIALESMSSLNLGFETFLTITFQPLIIDFLTIALKITTKLASVIFNKLQVTDINDYTFKMLLEENQIEKGEHVKNIVEILSNKFLLIEGLKKLHLQILKSPIPKIYRKEFVELINQIKKIKENEEENEIKYEGGECDDFEEELVFERYYRRMVYMIEMTKMLQTLSVEKYCYIEFVLAGFYSEICDYCVNFPFFLCFMSDERKNLVMTGGCYGTNTCFLETSNVSKILHFDLQYFLDDLIKLSIKDTQKIEGYSITPTKTDKVDVIITCQTVKLLPAASSIANKLIDAGLSCECRAIPLILTGDFNLRLRMVNSIKARVHLQKLANVTSEEMQTEKNQNDNTDKNVTEEEIDDKTHLNILYHVEPINGSFGQARKIDNEVALVHFIIGQLT